MADAWDSGKDHKPSRVIHAASWEEFEAQIKKFDDPTRKPWDEVWFRGQADSEWPLSTTLERRLDKKWMVSAYFNLISEVHPAIETFTDGRFARPDWPEEKDPSGEPIFFEKRLRAHATYLAHLRHGGFPSPLLDWTCSVYVAAYFAFHRARHDGNVAIYAYREWPKSSKVGSPWFPSIVSFGPNLKTHKRHFRQQSRYTACVQFEDGRWYFTPHDRVFGQKNHLEQDLLWKFTVPASERLKVLRFCDKVNLNEFTLFDTEEGLLELQATRFIDLRT